MKTNLFCICMVPALAVAAFAQGSTFLKADVPFDFSAGNSIMPAGRYQVERGPANGTVTIRSDDGKKAVIVMTLLTTSMARHEQGSLMFHRYGNAYILSEIWTPGNDGRELPTTKRERELAKKLAAPTSETLAAVQ